MKEGDTRVYLYGKTYLIANDEFYIRNDSVVHLAAGDRHTLIVMESGRVYAFGQNSSGQLGLGHTNQTDRVLCIKSLKFHRTNEKVLLAACGQQSSLVATNFGSLHAFGSNHRCQLGVKPSVLTKMYPSPIKIQCSSMRFSWKQISMGAEHACVLANNGQVYVWGSNLYGQCGFEQKYPMIETPTQLKLDYSVDSISCGYYHTALISTDGRLFLFGNNIHGQLACSNLEFCFEPREVVLPDRAQAIACGNQHTIVLTEKGNIYTCGQNDRGQLGLGQKISSADHFQLIENLPQKMSAIAAGEGHTIVVDCHGEIYAFGDNKYEKITSDTNLNLFEPFYVDQFRGFEVLQVVCGGQQTVILAKTKSIQDDVDESITRTNSISTKKTQKHFSQRIDNDDRLPTNEEHALSHITQKLASENHSPINNLQISIHSDDDRSLSDKQSVGSSDDQNFKRVSLEIISQHSYQSTNSGRTSSSISSIKTQHSTIISEIEEDLQHSFYSSTDDSSGKPYKIQSEDNHSNFFSRMFASHSTHKCTTTSTTTMHESKLCSLM